MRSHSSFDNRSHARLISSPLHKLVMPGGIGSHAEGKKESKQMRALSTYCVRADRLAVCLLVGKI